MKNIAIYANTQLPQKEIKPSDRSVGRELLLLKDRLDNLGKLVAQLGSDLQPVLRADNTEKGQSTGQEPTQTEFCELSNELASMRIGVDAIATAVSNYTNRLQV